MFPRLRQQILARVDLVVEFSTLGEYGIDEAGELMTLEPCSEPAAARAPRLRDSCGDATRTPPACVSARRAAPARP